MRDHSVHVPDTDTLTYVPYFLHSLHSLSDNSPLCSLTLKRSFSSQVYGVVLLTLLQVLRFCSGSNSLQQNHSSSYSAQAADWCCVMCC